MLFTPKFIRLQINEDVFLLKWNSRQGHLWSLTQCQVPFPMPGLIHLYFSFNPNNKSMNKVWLAHSTSEDTTSQRGLVNYPQLDSRDLWIQDLAPSLTKFKALPPSLLHCIQRPRDPFSWKACNSSDALSPTLVLACYSYRIILWSEHLRFSFFAEVRELHFPLARLQWTTPWRH